MKSTSGNTRDPTLLKAALACAAFTAVLCYLLLSGCSAKPKVPNKDLIALPAYSPSMRPALNGDEFTLIRATPFDQVKVGDVIVFEASWHKTWIAHRVVGKGWGRLITKGDNNPTDDPGFVTEQTYKGTLWHIDGRKI